MKRGVAAAKVNLALVVGAQRPDGMHEVATVYQRIALADSVEVRVAERTEVTGFAGDTLVARALGDLTANGDVRLAARITKRIPVAAGLGGGSADAATALRLGNELLRKPVPADRLDELGARLGADVPFFLRDGPQLGTGTGTELEPIELPQDYWILLVLPHGATKGSTADVYRRFDERNGADGFERRRAALLDAAHAVRRPRDLGIGLEHLLTEVAPRPRRLARRRDRCGPGGVRPVSPSRRCGPGGEPDRTAGANMAHGTGVVRLTPCCANIP